MATAVNPDPAGFAEFRANRTLRRLALAYALIWLATAIKPFHREDWLLENLLVFLALPVGVVLYRRRLLSNTSYALLFAFLSLHAIGAHFTYTEMPLGDFLRDHLHWSRNHYDRVVHFAFGLLVADPIRETLAGLGLKGRVLSRIVAVHVVMAWSGLYEIIEGMVAHLVSPELGAAFNGIQGDIWDAQKDMSLAMTGALCAMTFAMLGGRMRPRMRS
jgi:putative membrane protein